MNRRNFLKQIGIGIGTASVLPGCKSIGKRNTAQNKKTNFLIFIFDDLNMQVGCYGNKCIKTPYIDALAGNGVRFSRAYVQQPVCAASRSSILTGMYPDTTGVGYPYSYYFVEEVIPKYGTLPQYFFKNGYYTRLFGKVHHGYEEVLSEPNFLPKHKKYHLPENEKLPYSQQPPFEKADAPDSDYEDYKTAEAVIKGLQDASGRNEPFFFGVGLLKTHVPLNAPSKYWEMYDSVDIPLAENKYRPKDIPQIAFDRYNLRQYKWEHSDPDELFSDEYARKVRQAYYACVTFADIQIGRIMNELERQGLTDDTVVILASDHGYHLGELNHWGKTTLYEPSLNSPLIVSGKGIHNRGKNCNGLVEYIDIMPTMLDMAGIPIPQHVEGTSFKPLLDNPNQSWKKAAFSRQTRGWLEEYVGRSIRTDKYRYTEWQNILDNKFLGRELYNLSTIPYEKENIVNLPENTEIVKELSVQLHKGWKSTLPDGITNNSNNKPAPPPYSWGDEGVSRREQWHKRFGGNESEGWRKATERRLKKESEIKG